MMKSIFSLAGLVAAVAAYTPPKGPDPTYGSLLTPNGNSPLVTGQVFDITWTPKTPTDGVTVSLVLCNGPSANCVIQSSAIVEGVPAANAKYSWTVPCDLPLGTANTASGYGMLIIVDGTGEYQYSTQFSVVAGSSCGSSSSSSTTSRANPTTSSSSGRPTTSGSSSGSTSVSSASGTWIQWSGSPSSTMAVSTTKYTTTPAAITQTPTSSVSVASVTSAKPSSYTGAAAVPSAFVNVFAAVGAAGLAVFAL